MAKENEELDKLIENSAKGKKIDKKKLNEIIQKIEKENNNFIKKNKEMLTGIAPNKKQRVEIDVEDHEKDEEEKSKDKKDDEANPLNQDNDIEVDLEKISIVNRTSNCLIKLFSCLLPFKNDLNKIKIHYNTTVLTTFKIYRFIVLMSIFAFLIFLYECFHHTMKKRKNLSEICKYYIPCFLQYSSFEKCEAEIYSITYGGWLIFFSICSIAYYYVLNSEQKEQDLYFENNKNYIGCSYLVHSWNFNYKNEDLSSKSKDAIYDELKEYSKDFIDKIEQNSSKCYFLCNFLFNLIYLAFIFVYFALFFLAFIIRDLFRNNKKVEKSFQAMDIIGDLLAFLIIIALFHVFNKLTGFFPKFEGWRYEKYKYASNVIKKMITSFVGIFSLLFIYTYFTLYTNNLEDKVPFFGSTKATFFGCPGKYEDHRHTYHNYKQNILNKNYQKIKSYSYSKCREEETGIDFFIIFLLYFISSFLIDLFKNCFHCIFGCKPSFDPIKSMIMFFTNIILYSISMFYIPYLAILFPLVTILLYKFHLYLLNHKSSYSFNENGLLQRNKAKYLLISFLIFIIELIGIQGYFYLLSFPHYYKVNCYMPNEGKGDSSILLYDYDKKWCGPVKSYVRLSEVFTEFVEDAPIIGWIIYLVQEMPFLISVLALVFIILIYQNNGPDSKYNDFVRKKQRELGNTFRMYYDQVAKRDLLVSTLLKAVK